MSNATIQRKESPGALIDTEELVVGGNTVERVRIEIAGTAQTAIASPINADAAVGNSDYALTSRIVGRAQQPYCNGPFRFRPFPQSNLGQTAEPFGVKPALANRRKIKIMVDAAASPMVIGDSSVAFPSPGYTGLLLLPGQSTGWLPLGPAVDLYGAVPPGATGTIYIVEIGE